MLGLLEVPSTLSTELGYFGLRLLNCHYSFKAGYRSVGLAKESHTCGSLLNWLIYWINIKVWNLNGIIDARVDLIWTRCILGIFTRLDSIGLWREKPCWLHIFYNFVNLHYLLRWTHSLTLTWGIVYNCGLLNLCLLSAFFEPLQLSLFFTVGYMARACFLRELSVAVGAKNCVSKFLRTLVDAWSSGSSVS